MAKKKEVCLGVTVDKFGKIIIFFGTPKKKKKRRDKSVRNRR